MENFLNQVIIGNCVERWLIAAGIIIFGMLLVKLLKGSVFTRLKSLSERTQNNIDNFVLEKFEEFVIPAIYFLIVYWGILSLDLHIQVQNIVEIAFIVVVTYFALRLISSIFLLMLRSYVIKQENGEEKEIGRAHV